MSFKHTVIATSVLSALILSGCGSDSSDNASTPAKQGTVTPTEETTVTPTEETTAPQGQFIDAAVEGLYYETQPSGKSGFTDAEGRYDYEEGDTVSFFLGGKNGLRIGNTSARTITSPFEATGNFQKALNLARILQSMNDAGPGSITLPDSIKSPSPSMISALNNVMLHDLDSASDLKSELNLTDWVTEEQALAHLNDSLTNLERGSKEPLTDWQRGSGKYLRTITSTLSAQEKDSDEQLYVYADKLLPDDVFNATRGMPNMTLRLDEPHMTVLQGSNDTQTASKEYTGYYLTCLKEKGIDATYSTPDDETPYSRCDGEKLPRIDNLYDLGNHYLFALLLPQFAEKKDVDAQWENIKNYGVLYECLAEANCSEAKLTGFNITEYDDSEKQDGSVMQKDHLSTSYDAVTGVYTEVKKRLMTSGLSEGRRSESLSFAYLIDSPTAERYVDFTGTWQAVETRPNCDVTAKSTITFHENGMTVEGDEFIGNCQTEEISETATYEELAGMDFWWFTTNGAGNESKATLTQLNTTIRWCDSDEPNQTETCDSNDIKFNRWEYAPAGKNWDQGVLNRRTLSNNGEILSTISMYKK